MKRPLSACLPEPSRNQRLEGSAYWKFILDNLRTIILKQTYFRSLVNIFFVLCAYLIELMWQNLDYYMIVQFALGHILLSLALGKNWAQHLSDRGNILSAALNWGVSFRSSVRREIYSTASTPARAPTINSWDGTGFWIVYIAYFFAAPRPCIRSPIHSHNLR